MEINNITLDKKTVWKFQYKNLWAEIAHWGIERQHNFKPLNDGKGCWNYYVYVPEHLIEDKELFRKLWLPEKLTKFTPESSERVSYDYYECPLANIDWHGGITYYSKEGFDIDGHRVVKGGCDYSHLWDSERGYDYTLEEVIQDAKNTIDDIVLQFKVAQDKA